MANELGAAIIEDMVSARAFLGTNRFFDFYGSEGEVQAMRELEALKLVAKVADTTESPDGSKPERWYLTQEAASKLEARLQKTCLQLLSRYGL